MSSRQSSLKHDEHEPAVDARLFSLLDAYVESLRGVASPGEALDAPPELLHAFPELAGILDCLDSLETLAPASNGEATQVAADAPLPDDAPREFGNYELLGEIGRGGMGVVYRARHKALGAYVAVKLIRESRFASADEVRRFYQEARAAAGLTHAHIVKVHDVGEVDGQHYLAMDLVEGRTLAHWLQAGAMEPQPAAELLADVARAVAYLHSQGIVHRDLKPINVLVDPGGVPYVTDFGLAKRVSADRGETLSGTIIGTPSYMSPEQAGGRTSQVTTRSDVYSLGAILYEMITGRPVFAEDNPLDTLLCVLEREPLLPRKINPLVPADLEQICLRCLEKKPERRYASAADVAADLDRFLKREPISTPTIGPVRRFQRWLRREPCLVSRLLGLAIGAVIVQANYALGAAEVTNHWAVMSALACWALLSVGLQRLSTFERASAVVPYAWATMDTVLFTTVLCLAEGPTQVLLAGYPLLIAASGLWFRVRMVWFMTAINVVACAVLMATRRGPELAGHYAGLYIAMLIILGSIVAYQVYRLRVLSGYFDRQSARRSRA